MRLFPSILLGYIALGFQIGLKDALSFGDAPPDFVLLAVVFMGMHLPRKQGLFGAFLIGLTQDCLSLHPLGLYALAYGLTAWMIYSTHQAVHRQHPLAHFSLTLLGGLVCAVILAAQALTHPAMRGSIGTPFITAIYTALLAPGVLWIGNQIFASSSRSAHRAY